MKSLSRKRLLLAAALAFAVASIARPQAAAQEIVFVVRHAEAVQDGSRNPPLTPEGERRARSLADLLGQAGIGAIYTSDLDRTIATAKPLAQRLGLETRSIPQAPFEEGLVACLAREHAGERVLVVGHSNTVPELLLLFGHDGVPVIERRDHGNLFVVMPRATGAPTVVRLRMEMDEGPPRHGK